jgi:hypothetical protein
MSEALFFMLLTAHGLLILGMAIYYEVRCGLPIKKIFAKHGIRVGHPRSFPVFARSLSVRGVLAGLYGKEKQHALQVIEQDVQLQCLIKKHHKLLLLIPLVTVIPYLGMILFIPDIWQKI